MAYFNSWKLRYESKIYKKILELVIKLTRNQNRRGWTTRNDFTICYRTNGNINSYQFLHLIQFIYYVALKIKKKININKIFLYNIRSTSREPRVRESPPMSRWKSPARSPTPTHTSCFLCVRYEMRRHNTMTDEKIKSRL